jgi:hypothetical protein
MEATYILRVRKELLRKQKNLIDAYGFKNIMENEK